MAQERRILLTPDQASPIPPAEGVISHSVTLTQEQTHYLLSVLRLEVGAAVSAINPVSQKSYEAVLSSLSPATISLSKEICSAARDAYLKDVLILPLLKNDHTELAIEKCTELGISEIRLYQSERSVIKLDQKDLSHKKTRWRRIAETASSQCGRSAIPEVSILLSLQAAIAGLSPGLYASLNKGALEIKSVPARTENIPLVVGPEGDFSPSEIELLAGSGFQAVSLGPLVLRAETAAMVLVASLRAVWGDRAPPHEMP